LGRLGARSVRCTKYCVGVGLLRDDLHTSDLGWLLRRSYSVGNSDMRVLLKHTPGALRVTAELLKILASLLLSPLAAVILAVSPNRRALALQKLFRAAGKLSAMFGARYNEYAVIHGE